MGDPVQPTAVAAHRSGLARGAPSEPELHSLLLNIPLQLLAYHVALLRGTDIDQPAISPSP